MEHHRKEKVYFDCYKPRLYTLGQNISFLISLRIGKNHLGVINEVLTGLEGNKSIKNHKPMNHSEMTVERFKTIKEGKKLEIDKLPENLKYSRSGKLIRNYSNIFKRLIDGNELSCTLVQWDIKCFPIHPWKNRQLTIREAARIQTFPDDVEFSGSQSDQCTQVGNAFPVLVAEQFANNITKCVKNNWTKSGASSLAYYGLY